MKSFINLLTELVRSSCKDESVITSKEARTMIKELSLAFDRFGLNFNFSTHVAVDRLSSSRNDPPISKCEFDFVMAAFIKKWANQINGVVRDITAGKLVMKGKGAKAIPPNEFEGVITSSSTNINIAFAIKKDTVPGRKHELVFLPITVIRKRSFKITKGVRVYVENAADTDTSMDSINVFDVD